MELNQLKHILINGSEPKQRQAAEDLIGKHYFDEDVIAFYLNGLTSESKGIRDVSFTGLSNVSSDYLEYTAKKLSPLIKSKNIELRNNAGELLVLIGKQSLKYIYEHFNDDNPDVRKFAVDTAGLIADDESTLNNVLTIIDDSNTNVALSAIECACNIFSKSPELYTIPVHNKLISKYGDFEASKIQIIEGLGKIPSDLSQNFIIEKLKEEDDIFLQANCIDSLAYICTNKEICLDLYNNLENIPEELQTTALKAIYAIAQRIGFSISISESNRQIAHKALMDEDAEIRAAGLLALGQIYSTKDIPYLINEIINFNQDTALFIIQNIMQKSDLLFIETFFNSLLDRIIETKDLYHYYNFFELINIVWYDSDKNRESTLIDTLVNYYLKYNHKSIIELLKIIYDLDKHQVFERIEKLKDQNNYEQKTKLSDLKNTIINL